MPSPDPSACPHCGSSAAVRAGRRQLKDGTRTGKQTDPAAILRALTLVSQGGSFIDEDVFTELLKGSHALSKVTRHEG